MADPVCDPLLEREIPLATLLVARAVNQNRRAAETIERHLHGV